MVKDALSLAAVFRTMEVNTIESLLSCGALLSAEIIADAKQRLSLWRGLVCSALIDAGETATEAERRELFAALILITASS